MPLDRVHRRLVCVLLAALLVIPLWWAAAGFLDVAGGIRRGVTAGAAIAIFLAGTGLAANAWAAGRTGKQFLRILVGGMVLRLFLLGIAAAAIWRQSWFDPVAALLVLGALYFGLLVLEALLIGLADLGGAGGDGKAKDKCDKVAPPTHPAKSSDPVV